MNNYECDDDNPFYLEQEVDDEISFVKPRATAAFAQNDSENEPPSNITLSIKSPSIPEKPTSGATHPQVSSSPSYQNLDHLLETGEVENLLLFSQANKELPVKVDAEPKDVIIGTDVNDSERQIVVEEGSSNNTVSTTIVEIEELNDKQQTNVYETSADFFESESDNKASSMNSDPPKINVSDTISITSAAVPELMKRRTRRVSVGLLSSYDDSIHMPKYSQAELDVALEELRTTLEASLVVKSSGIDPTLKASYEERLTRSDEEKARLEAIILEVQSTAKVLEAECGLQKTQMKALSRHSQVLQSELAGAEDSKAAALALLAAQHADELSRAASEAAAKLLAAERLVEERCTQTHRAAVQILQDEVGRLQGAIQVLEENARSFEDDKSRAVSDAKAKVYEKVKVQFENGNKEFQKLKASLKESEVDREEKAKENELLNTIVRDADDRFKLQSASLASRNGTCDELVNNISKIAEAVLSPSDLLFLEFKSSVSAEKEKKASDSISIGPVVERLVVKVVNEHEAMRTSVEDLKTNKDSLLAAVSALESSLRRAEAQLSAATIKGEALESRAALAEALLGAARMELQEANRDRDEQMDALARMITAENAKEQQLSTTTAEINELKERCSKLRTMNEELLAMLEM